jgi:excisionase family DNA binding protein
VSTSPNNSLLMRPLEVGQALSLSKATVYRLLASNAIPSVKVGKSIRVRRADLEAWVAGLGKEVVAEYQTAASGGDQL